MDEINIVCPECGGNLEYWKEYIVTKKQSISKNGVLSRSVKTTTPQEFNCNDMNGLQCKKCRWIFNTVNDVEKCDKYPHLIQWVEEHEDEFKV